MLGQSIDHERDAKQIEESSRHGRYVKAPDGSEHWVYIERQPYHYTTAVYHYRDVRKDGALRKNAKAWLTGWEYRGHEKAEEWLYTTCDAIEAGETVPPKTKKRS